MTIRVAAEKAILAFEAEVVTRPAQAEMCAARRIFFANCGEVPS
jgi:hypothetical protein